VKGHTPLSTEIDQKVEMLTHELTELATELQDKTDMPVDRITAIEAEITVKSTALDNLIADKKAAAVESKLAELDERVKAFARSNAVSKASAILAGAGSAPTGVKSVGRYNENNFLSAIVNRRLGDTDAQEFVKAVLGTSAATGGALVPGNFVSTLVEQVALVNPYRDLFNVVTGVQGAGVNIPYDNTAITAALLQGAYGSNKDVRDFGFASATATLYTIAQIADIGNQLLRQSNGAAEQSARRRLASSIGLKEAQLINNGSGSSEPLGFFPALAAFGQVAAFITTLSSEPRVAAIGRGIAAMEARGIPSTNLAVIMSPTDYWEAATEGLGTSYAGGWAIDPAAGASASPPPERVWGVPVRRDATWPAAQVGTALIVDRTEVEMFTGDEFRIDVSSEAGSRFDQNITGFRAEEEFGFNAEPYVRTGKVQRVNGL
jgi:HK97 family phage major capsid protein